MGDIASLARSIADMGLLHSIVVTPDMRLVAGERRLRAYQALSRMRIPATVVDLDQIVRGEYAESGQLRIVTTPRARGGWLNRAYIGDIEAILHDIALAFEIDETELAIAPPHNWFWRTGKKHIVGPFPSEEKAREHARLTLNLYWFQ